MTLLENIKETTMKDRLIIIAIMLIIIGAGLFSINQYASFRYKTVLIQQPCNLCIEKYPNAQSCLVQTINKNNVYNLSGLTLNLSLP